mmetsp:Transcript_15910/g.25573  ORF Transcript_15910/g.25573 Transcript_15910/m.25573 type:complete len:111 (-) Transcript_15910:145-477(-)
MRQKKMVMITTPTLSFLLFLPLLLQRTTTIPAASSSANIEKKKEEETENKFQRSCSPSSPTTLATQLRSFSFDDALPLASWHLMILLCSHYVFIFENKSKSGPIQYGSRW